MKSFPIKTFLMITTMLIAFLASACLIQSVQADKGLAKVYVLMLPNVGGSWVDSCEQVRDGHWNGKNTSF